MNTDKTNPKMINELFSSKYSHGNSGEIITGCSSDPTNSEEIHSTSVPREIYK